MQNQALENRLRVAAFEYNFANDGGAVGDIALGTKILPKGALILGGMIHVKTAVTSDGSATVALKINSSEDVLAATAKASLSAAAKIDTVPVWTAATSILTTAAAQVTATVGTAALTAGRFVVFLFYVQSFNA